MSKKEWKRYKVIRQWIEGYITGKQAAELLSLSLRQVYRLKKRVLEPRKNIHLRRPKFQSNHSGQNAGGSPKNAGWQTVCPVQRQALRLEGSNPEQSGKNS